MSLAEQHRLDHARNIPTLVDCGCVATVWNDESGVEIDYCPMHQAAPDMRDALIWLSTAIMPEECKYDRWRYCKIHHDTLCEFNDKVTLALAKAKGE